LIRKISGKNLHIFTAVLLIVLIFHSYLGIDLSIGVSSSPSIRGLFSSIAKDTDQLTNKTFFVDEWRREIILDAWGGISGIDYYSIPNVYSTEIYKVSFLLPANASEIRVQDAYGEYSVGIIKINREDTVQVNVTLRRPLKPREKNEFLISYRLPSDMFIDQIDWQDYRLELKLVKPKNVLRYNVTEFSMSHITLEYQYSVLWRAFKPLTWIGATALVFVAFFLIKRFFYPTATALPVPSTLLGDFVKLYEEKRRLTIELRSVEEQFRSGRISRRRLRIRRRTIEHRISELNKRLAELKNRIKATSDRYGELIKELEAAEIEIETLNADIDRVEARFKRGEISADVRRRLIDEYAKIRQRTEGRISEILLRLQEEASG